MREILFRGKAVVGADQRKEWVYGGFVKARDFLGDGLQGSYIVDDSITIEGKGLVSYVDPDTVGQYTGVTINNKKIFEGDVLDIVDFPEIGKVKIEYEDGAFQCVPINNNTTKKPLRWYLYCEINMEKIGNIYDKPKLLGGDR